MDYTWTFDNDVTLVSALNRAVASMRQDELSSVLKRWDASGHRQIVLAFRKEKTTGKKLSLF